MATRARITTPPGRYGSPSRGRRLALMAAVAGVVALFLAWVVWAALHHARTNVSGDVSAFSVVSAHEIEVTLSVQRPTGALAVCSVEARASDHGLVAARDVTVPAGRSGSVQVTATIRTDRAATSADVTGCRS